ncbi:LacI family DNA-binding transcriptional regulator [Streptococcus cuniculi]|uniref:LacI family transcriptional regulator n=1 Tax=Streptococcus cuniculi TaxID=1432788 RepID=A0A4Y9JFY5_9STRE|nr:LacI family DNA-binding transcriptional regulator [Streptococcus cuniculi]MBF0777317.1 LacI family DNA-binding transcriptional regulator [Streptococcus cuniculi]TFU98919.1 LacI family transcriptional regulator [Streptococcus cuniculi]
MGKKAITIRDVARVAKVSVSAVSKVFNHYGDISEETKIKVYEAAKKLNYIPSQAARQLSSKNTKIIALILNEIKVVKGLTMPFEILSEVSNYLDETDYEFVFYATTAKKQGEKSLEQFCSEHSIDGIIIQGLKTTDPYYKELDSITLPTVAIDLKVDNGAIGTISIDNQAAAAEVTRRLIATGHPNILFINGTKEAEVSQKREAGYRSQVKEATVLYAQYSEEEAFNLILNLKDLERFDAIFAASDLMAIGIINALKLRGLQNEISVVGFDDIALASYVTPSLTTVRQDMKLISQNAVKDLLTQIETGEIHHRLIPHRICIRESACI